MWLNVAVDGAHSNVRPTASEGVGVKQFAMIGLMEPLFTHHYHDYCYYLYYNNNSYYCNFLLYFRQISLQICCFVIFCFLQYSW